MNIKVFNLISNLISLIVTILTILVLSIGSNVTAQTTLDPTTQEIENFFDPQYRDIAKCVKEAYKQNNGNRIAGFPTTLTITYPTKVVYDTNTIKTKIKEACPNLNVNNIIDSDLETVVYCLDEIELIPGVGWNQVHPDRLQQCIRATKNTFGIHRQAFVDCVIRKRFNPDTRYLDKDLSSDLTTLCVEEQNKVFVFPKNISSGNTLPYYSALIYCLDHNQSQPKLRESGLFWDWESDGHIAQFSPILGAPNCRWVIQDFSQLRMKTPTELGIGFGAGSGENINLPDLNFNPIRIDVPTEQTCWISKEGMNVGPSLTNIWNPGDWLPIMYKCQNTTSDGRPIPLHPINLIPIAIRLFAFVTSLLIWLIVINIIVGIILFIVGVAKSILAWVKNILIGSVAVVIVLIFMYSILYFILSILKG
jgi:hypothetical protein